MSTLTVAASVVLAAALAWSLLVAALTVRTAVPGAWATLRLRGADPAEARPRLVTLLDEGGAPAGSVLRSYRRHGEVRLTAVAPSLLSNAATVLAPVALAAAVGWLLDVSPVLVAAAAFLTVLLAAVPGVRTARRTDRQVADPERRRELAREYDRLAETDPRLPWPNGAGRGGDGNGDGDERWRDPRWTPLWVEHPYEE